jgi:hypothetical protein
MFVGARSGEYAESENRTAPIDKDALHSTAVHYEQLRIDFEKLRAQPETTPDPSL